MLIRDLRENEVKKEQADGDDGEECPGDDALAVAAAKGIAFFEKAYKRRNSRLRLSGCPSQTRAQLVRRKCPIPARQ